MPTKKIQSQSAFTLLEILLVVGIIAILAGIIIIAINPGKQLASVRNVQRKANLAEINKALYQYYIDNSRYPVSVTSTLTEICNTGTASSTHGLDCTGLADLSYLVPTYLTAIPTDPQMTGTSTRYKVMKNSSNKIVLEATQAEQGTLIAVGAYTNCGLTLVDARDGKEYSTVAIGAQCWMQQNLNVGTMVTGVTTQTNDSIIEKYCFDNNEGNCPTYGGLYQWDEAMGYVTTAGAQGICPTGWHIPTHNEYTTLERAICTSGSCTTDFPIDITTIGWRGTNEGSHLSNLTLNHDNTSGFTALLAGNRDTNGSFYYTGGNTYLWSSLESETLAWVRYLNSGYATVLRNTASKSYGFSVRCLKD